MFRNNKKIKECRKQGASYLCKKEICNLDSDAIDIMKNDLIQARGLLSENLRKTNDEKELPTYGLFVCDDGMVMGKPTKSGNIKILFFDPIFTDNGELVTSQTLEDYIEDKRNKVKLKKAEKRLVDNVYKTLESISSKSKENPKIYMIDNIYKFDLKNSQKDKIYAFKKLQKKSNDDPSNIGLVYNTGKEWMVSFLKSDKLNKNGQFVEAQLLELYLKM